MDQSKIQEILAELESTQKEFWNIDRETAEFLLILLKINKPKQILEIGTSNGYSTIWLALANPEANITTIEKMPERAQLARENFKKALLKNINLLEGDAKDLILKLKTSFDFIFIDGMKKEYITYFLQLESKMKKGCVIVADNILSHKDKLQKYLDYVQHKPIYKSHTLNIGKGLEISTRK